MNPYTLYRSTNPKKKFDIYVRDGRMLKKVSFGDSRYQDYTTHKDVKRRESYRARHSGDNINDPLSPGFWSWNLLWGDTTDLQTNLKNTIKKFRLV